MAVDDETFRAVCGRLAAGVTIVCALDGDGQPRGLTTTAVCSVSLDPPLLLVCVAKTSRTLAAIAQLGAFTVNVLAEGREELAARFATQLSEKFDGVRWVSSEAADGAPILVDDAIAVAACRTVERIDAGDHVVFIGSVERGAIDDRHASPLVYFRGLFGGWPGALPKTHAGRLGAVAS